MASRNYASINPWSNTKGLPKLSAPGHPLSGKLSKSNGFTKFQWCPTDTPEAAGDDYVDTHDEMFYTVNRQNFRADQFKKINDKPVLMCLGDSYTYGIGVRDAETWPSIVADKLDMVNWNMGSGGAGNQDIYLIFQQMISNGYIPDVVCIQWSFKERQIVSRNLISDVVEEKDLMPESRRKESVQEQEKDINAFSDLIAQTNTRREIDHQYYARDHENTNESISSHWSGFESHAEQTLMKSALYTCANTDSDYVDFFIVRSAIANICKAYGIKLRETFLDFHLQKFAIAHFVPVDGWQTGKYPINTYTLEQDYARDQQHYGPKTLEAIASYYLSTLQ